MPILSLEHVCYAYSGGRPVLQDLSYTFERGKIYAIVGRSGAGKTTLLSLLSALARPTSGRILFEDRDVRTIDPYRYRSRHVGVVFQSFNLLPNLTAVENVELSMDIAGNRYSKAQKRQKAMELLWKVELDEDRGNRRILKLSGGEQQRVAIARALSYDPAVLLADEPTGNLDGETQDAMMEILRRLAVEEDKCIIVVTHSPAVAQAADIVYRLERPAPPARKSPVKKPAAVKKAAPPPPHTPSTLGLD